MIYTSMCLSFIQTLNTFTLNANGGVGFHCMPIGNDYL